MHPHVTSFAYYFKRFDIKMGNFICAFRTYQNNNNKQIKKENNNNNNKKCNFSLFHRMEKSMRALVRIQLL